MKIRRYVSAFLIVIMLVSSFSGVSAEISAEMPKEISVEKEENNMTLLSDDDINQDFDGNNQNFKDTSHMSDEDFFGVWDEENNTWKTRGRINYDYSEDLNETERYVKLGGYTMAKKALYKYYQNRTSIQKPDLYSGNNKSFKFLTMNDMYNFSEDYISSFTVTSDNYTRYEIDLGTTTAGGVFMLAALKKDGDVLSVISKEGDPNLAPKLVLYYSTGSVVELPAVMDSYTRAYDNVNDYRGQCFGEESDIEVKDSWYQNESGRYLPYSSDTREGYIAFDASKISGTNLTSVKLVINAKLKAEEGENRVETSKEIIVFNAYNKSWREKESDSGTYPILTWENISHNHYSWNGLPGGFDWAKPEYAASEYINYNMRMTQLPALIRPYMQTGDESYMKKAIEIALDFINDAGAANPPNRELEPAQRILEMTPAFFYFGESSMMNAEAATAMLKYFCEEGDFLYEAPVYYDYNNRGLWHTTAFITLVSYFPEISKSEWKPKAEKRLDDIVHTLIHDDGCYNEATLGYPNSIITFLQKLVEAYNNSGKAAPDYLKEKLSKLCGYMMACAYPNGVTLDWGEGGRGYMTYLATPAELLDNDEFLFAATGGKEGKAPEETTFRFDNLKIVTSRTDWGNNAYVLFMNAKNGGYHNHKDSLALTFYAKDREVLCDTGMTSYDSKHPHFDWQRHQTKSHNTIEIDNTGQRGDTSTLTGNGDSSIEVYESDSNDRIMAWTDASLGFRHYRNVTFLKNLKFLIVSDMVRPLDDKPHTYTQNWHAPINSGASIDSVTKTGTTNFAGGSNIKIIQTNPDSMTASLETGYSSDQQSVTGYFSYKQTASGDISYDTILLPIEEGNTTDAVVTNINTDTPNQVSSAMQISLFKNDDERQSVVYYNSHEYDENGKPVPTKRSFGEYMTDSANVTLIKDAEDKILSASFCFGTLAEQGGNPVLKSSVKLDNLSVEFGNGEAVIESGDENIENAEIAFKTDFPVKKVLVNGSETPFTENDGIITVNGSEVPAPVPPQSSVESSGGNAGSGSGGKFPAGGIGGAVKPSTPTEPINPDVPNNSAETSFNDVSGHWAEEEVLELEKQKVIRGNDDGSFEPDKNISRAEFAAICVRATGTEAAEYNNSFDDVAADDWFAAEVQAAYNNGWIKGSDGSFRPNDMITRAEAAAVICRVFSDETPSKEESSFTDSDTFEVWAAEYIGMAEHMGIIKGYKDGSFRPNLSITRAEAAVMLYRAENTAIV